MNMVKSFVSLALISVLASPAHATEVMSTSDYKEIRKTLRDNVETDFQAQRACDILEGGQVNFESKVTSVSRSGTIKADMDDDFFSMSDITLTLIDSDEAISIKPFSHIQYMGRISECTFSRGTGSLDLVITRGSLKLHY